jgi:hypothetical protein
MSFANGTTSSQPHLADDFDTPNARSIRDRSFNLYLNENYRERQKHQAQRALSTPRGCNAPTKQGSRRKK